MFGKKFLLFARAALGNINGRKKTSIGELAIEDQFHITSTFEFLESEFIHTRSSMHESCCENRQRAAFFDFASRSEQFSWNFHCACIHATGHCSTATAMDAVVSASHASDGIEQHENIFARFNHASATLDHKAGEADMGLK